jgi:hypothetical protein
MKDIQIWLYIIIGVIYFLSRLKKKPEQQPKDIADFEPEKPVRNFEIPPARPTAAPQKGLTFEELLREISQEKTKERSQPEYVDYDDAIEEEEKDLEDVNYDYRKQDKIYEVYDEAKKQAFHRPSLEETMKVGDTDVRFGKFKVFEEETKRDLMAEYLADFKDPEGFKKAVVMSEILKRKF